MRQRFSILKTAHRQFSSTPTARTSSLKINSARLQETIHKTCEWGAEHRYGQGPFETGMSRLSLSDDDGRVRKWFSEETQSLGCTVTVDQMGNMFARLPGRSTAGAPMTGMGSHLDTQPRGGRYDGILGVTAAVEILRTIQENGWKPNYDIGAINWTNEEGARFPKSMCSSGVWAGAIPIQEAWDLTDIHDPSLTLRSQLERLGYLGQTKCSSDADGFPLAAHFELHIEQGPILESNRKSIGVVQGAQGYRWLTITVHGKDAHTGTTPLSARQDPLLAAAKMIASSSEIAKSLGALASTGILQLPANSSTNTIPSSVTFTLDIRHPKDATLSELQDRCLASFGHICKADGRGVKFSWKLDTDSKAVEFHADSVGAVQRAAVDVAGENGWIYVNSGAGHDSVYTNRVCPTAMIFVPCQDGVSHNPTEYSSPDQCAIGAQTLLESVVNYDKMRLERGY